MKFLLRIAALFLVVGLAGGLLAMQRIRFGRERFRYDEELYQSAERTEFAFARLAYEGYTGPGACFGYSKWGTDYPKGDRQFVQGLKRLTRLDTRAIEQVVDPDTDEVFDWPWLFATEPGSWTFSDSQVQRMRDYFLKGGFLMVDDFHGTCEWRVFMLAVSKLFPGRPVEDLTDQDEIYHLLYDINERFQIAQIGVWRSGRRYEKDGVVAQWRAVRDDSGRIMIAIGHNMDLADAWEWADEPTYAERFSSLAYRVGINYIMYAMTH
jgi:hypothetical protein